MNIRSLFIALAVALQVSCYCAAESGPGYSVGGSVGFWEGTPGFELGNDDPGTWSKLEWPLSGMIGNVDGVIVWPLASDHAFVFGGRYGRALSLSGTGKDWDWRPWEQPGVLSDYSETDSSGDLSILYLHAGYRFPIASSVTLQLLAGYEQTSVDIEDQNMVGSYDYGTTPVSYPGTVATYAAEYVGIILGAELAVNIGEKLILNGCFKVIPDLSATADANWIRQGDTFHQEASGMDLTIAGEAGYEIQQDVVLTVGVEWNSCVADQDGRQSGTYDGSSYNSDIVREMTLDSLSALIGVRISF